MINITTSKETSLETKRKDTEIPLSSVPMQADIGFNTPRSGEDSLQLKELMEFCTKLQQRVLDLENIKTATKGIDGIDVDEDITLENVHDTDMFVVHDLDGDEVFVETEEHVVNAATTTRTIPVSAAKDLSDVDMTLAQALAELKNTKPKHEQASTPITSSKDKGKGIMVEEPLKMKKKDQVNVETDYELAQRLQVEEQEELTIEEKSKLFQQLLEKRRKHFAAKRVEERRNRPPTKAKQRSIMVNTFVDMDTELVGGSEVREECSETREEGNDDKETEELKQCMKIISDDGDDVTIEATPLSTKSPTIMLKNFDRVDLEVLWSIVKARFKKTEPVNYMDIFLHLNLKTMFEHHLGDSVWKNQQVELEAL
ncbi:hypothetical protein Tco_0322781 [Tanacetum coccineum]